MNKIKVTTSVSPHHRRPTRLRSSLASLGGWMCSLALAVGVAVPALAVPGTWTPISGPGINAEFHTATLMPDGKVLVAGGVYPSDISLYDPTKGTWTNQSWNVGVMNNTATLMADGQVLFTGGTSGGSPLGTSDVTAYGGILHSSMNNQRRKHTANLLPNGKLLVIGGGVTANITSDLYDPSTGTWSYGVNGDFERYNHTATQLYSGSVLVVGGRNSSYLNTVVESSGGSPTFRARLHYARGLHTATLLSDGRVLVTGGYDGTNFLDTCEIYDPATNDWDDVASLPSARGYHTASLLPNGLVLVAGGYDGSAISSCALYNPITDTWTATDSLPVAEAAHTSTVLATGQVLLVAKFGTYLYDPTDGGSFASTGSFTGARAYATQTLLPNGKVIMAGGENSGSYYSGTQIFDPAGGSGAGTWAGIAGTNFSTGRIHHTTTLLRTGEALLVGGWSGTNTLGSCYLFDYTTESWSSTGTLSPVRYGHAATLLPDGKVLVAGGYTASTSTFRNDLDRYDPVTGTWTAAPISVNLATARSGATSVLLPSGLVLIAGGNNGSPLASAELFDPAGTGSISSAGSFSTARYYHSLTLLPNGKVLLAGGYNGSNLSDCQMYDPSNLVTPWSTVASMTTSRSRHTATLLPDGRVLVAGGSSAAGGGTIVSSTEIYDPISDTWTASTSMTSARRSHIATLLPSGKVLIGGGYNGGYLLGCQLFDKGLGYSSAWQPTISTVTSPLTLGNSLSITGTSLAGISEASGGGTNNSPSDHPVVQLRRLDNGQTKYLNVDSSGGWSSTTFGSTAVTGFNAGPTLVTVFANGIPSTAVMITVQ